MGRLLPDKEVAILKKYTVDLEESERTQLQDIDLEVINFDRSDIPKKYWKKETSGLKKSIVEGVNDLQLEL